MSKQYDYQDLIQAYINVGRFSDPEFRRYYTGLVSALEQLFQVQIMNVKRPSDLFNMAERMEWSLHELFENTVIAMQSHGIMSGWLEGGPSLALARSRESNPQAEKTYQALSDALDQERRLNQHYRRLVYDLFALIFGKTDLIFTSEDLLRMGFDDAAEPELDEFSG